MASLSAGCASAPPQINYAESVWPPPPDKPRIQLKDVVLGPADTLAKSRFQRALLGSWPQGPFDWFERPFAVGYDARGRLLVTDSALGALFRFDRAARKVDVLGTTGAVSLKTPEHFIKWVKRILERWDSKEIQAMLADYSINGSKRPDMKSLTFVQIDEFYPMDSQQHNSFNHYVREYYIKGFVLEFL